MKNEDLIFSRKKIFFTTIILIFIVATSYNRQNIYHSKNKLSKISSPWSGWKRANCYNGLMYKTRIKNINNHDCKIQIAFYNVYSNKITVYFRVTEYYIRKDATCSKYVELKSKKTTNGGDWYLKNCYHDGICRFKVWICEKPSTYTTKKGTFPLPCDKKNRK